MFESFKRNKRGVVVMAIIGLAIALLVGISILPTAIDQFSNSTTWGNNTSDAVVTLATVVVPIVAIAAVIMLVVKEIT